MQMKQVNNHENVLFRGMLAAKAVIVGAWRIRLF